MGLNIFPTFSQTELAALVAENPSIADRMPVAEEREAVIASHTDKVTSLQTRLVNELRRAALAQREAKQRGWTGKANE